MTTKPKSDSPIVNKEMEKLEKQFDEFNENVKEMTMDRMNLAPKQETEPQTKIATSDLDKMKDVYLKPSRSLNDRSKFNERFREEYNFAKEYVHFIAENNEIKGDMIELWTRPYGGMPCEFWQVPANKPVWGPRYLAEQIKRKYYHRMVMQNTPTNGDGVGQYYGTMAVDTTIQRIDARPVTSKRSVFMGAKNF